ncbi:D-glycerate 2-kinase [hydrothermal vent metagenome]|uniref:D-glycerate 2-kinase n=1 Tax=hydrothermal vent metagenome TaxID=652676 RepID=A0A3B1A7I8_9ZZZZ
MTTNLSQRKKILRIYSAALKVVHGEESVAHYLSGKEFSQRIVDNEKVAILAVGKAAQSMAQGAYVVVKENFLRGLVISKQGYLQSSILNSQFDCFESSHPVPSEKSLIAGQKLVDFVTGLPEKTHLIVLISGGTSALVEQLKIGISLNDLIKVNSWLLGSGLAIEKMNTIRQRLSNIKGGQLASFARHLKVSNLLLSDVLSNAPCFIGSGLFVENITNTAVVNLPDWLKKILSHTIDNQKGEDGPEIFTGLVATNTLLLNKIGTLCDSTTKIAKFDRALSGTVEQEAEKIAKQVMQGESGFYIWGGEPTVKLPANAGKGGRNQHLALLVANKIQEMRNIVVLCIGTDGTDGNTEDAGALVDSETVLRGEQDGFSVEECIQSYNSSTFLHASGDVVNTGATGTNVMDVVIAYKWELDFII